MNSRFDVLCTRNQVAHIAEIWKRNEGRAREEIWDWHYCFVTKVSQWNLPRVTRSGKLSAIFISSRNFAKWEVERRSRHEEGKRWKSQRLVHASLSHNGGWRVKTAIWTFTAPNFASSVHEKVLLITNKIMSSLHMYIKKYTSTWNTVKKLGRNYSTWLSRIKK